MLSEPEPRLSDLLVGRVEEQVPLRSPHGQTEAVDDVHSRQEEAEEAQLLAALHPALEPQREMSVLGAIVELVSGCQLACQVHQGQQRDGNSGQCPIHHFHGDLVEVALLVLHVWVDDIPHKGIRKEEDRQGHSSQNGTLPAGKQSYWHVLYVP